MVMRRYSRTRMKTPRVKASSREGLTVTLSSGFGENTIFSVHSSLKAAHSGCSALEKMAMAMSPLAISWGRLMAFLFVWQFLISGPLEVASGLIAIAIFSSALHPEWAAFNEEWTEKIVFSPNPELSVTVSPSRLLAFTLGVFILVLLYRRITILGRLTVAVWVGVLGVIVLILFEGFRHFNPAIAFDFSGTAAGLPSDFAVGLGGAMALAMYSYLGYYNICYVGDEVREP